MSVRKRTWERNGVAKTAWVVDYKDSQGKRRLKTFATKKAADAFFGPGDIGFYFDVDLLQSLGTIGSTFSRDHETIDPAHTTDLVRDWSLGE